MDSSLTEYFTRTVTPATRADDEAQINRNVVFIQDQGPPGTTRQQAVNKTEISHLSGNKRNDLLRLHSELVFYFLPGPGLVNMLCSALYWPPHYY